MTPEPGPVVEGYVDQKFRDENLDVGEGDVYIAALERDFEAEE